MVDINGFIPEASKIFPRQELSKKGATGRVTTLTREVFEDWVKKLYPVLGDYYKKEPMSIVILNNALTHNS